MRRTPPEGARLRLTSPTLYILKHLVGRRAGPGRWSYHWRSHCHRPGTRTGDGHSFTPLLHAQASGGLGTSGPMSALLLRRRSCGRGCNAGSTPPLASDPNWNAGARIFTSLGSTCFSVRPSGFSESRADVSRKHLLAHAALSPPPKALPLSRCASPPASGWALRVASAGRRRCLGRFGARRFRAVPCAPPCLLLATPQRRPRQCVVSGHRKRISQDIGNVSVADARACRWALCETKGSDRCPSSTNRPLRHRPYPRAHPSTAMSPDSLRSPILGISRGPRFSGRGRQEFKRLASD